ncbi:MAG: radical SAM protein [Candidatus Methanoperedens sp.]|nr:radical SAM protein [Candidatus Methanoperedens sp.]
MKPDLSGVKRVPSDILHVSQIHPCFSIEGHGRSGRIHLPVSPACNIQCKFCMRSFNKTENRPGVASSVLAPQDALEMLEKALLLCPGITVAGIAGPGDPLATDHALRTFELIDAAYPDMIKCLSTNGLNLPDKAERIAEIGIRTVTVTVNAVQPEILARLCSHVIINNRVLNGIDAASHLIEAQLQGIGKITTLGAVVKVNTVLAPGINDQHISEIAKATARAGASMINIIPLIPQYELNEHPGPDCHQVQQARDAAEKYLPVFRHCMQCRADAAGVPGISEFRHLLYTDSPLAFSHG